MKIRTIGCFALLLAVVGTLSSNVALDVKQGASGAAESSVFNSPMIITTAFAATDRACGATATGSLSMTTRSLAGLPARASRSGAIIAIAGKLGTLV